MGVTPEQVARIQSLHAQAYQELAPHVRPLPGARELLTTLTSGGVPWAIATSGRWDVAGPVLETLGVPEGVPIVTRDQVRHAKPDPDLFLAAAVLPSLLAGLGVRVGVWGATDVCVPG